MKKLLGLFAVAPLAVSACTFTTPIDSTKGESYDEITIKNFDELKNETEQTFDSVPTRVIAEGQGSVDLLVALGLGDTLVGTYQGTTKEMKPEWDFTLPEGINKESVPHTQEEALALNPDFIIGTTTAPFLGTTSGTGRLETTKYWQDRGVGTFVHESQVDYPSTLEKEYNDIINIGKIFNVSERADALIEEIKADIDSHELETYDNGGAIASTTNVLIYQDRPGTGYKHWGTNTYGQAFLQKINWRFNIMGLNQWGKNQIEHIVAMGEPDIIIIVRDGITFEDDAAAIKSTTDEAAFAGFPAVINNNIFTISTADLISPSSRAADSIGNLSAALAKAVV